MKFDFNDLNKPKKSFKESLPEANLLITALDELACGLLIIDAQAHLLHSNLAGQVHLSAAKHLHLNKLGLVTPTDAKDESALLDAIGKALDGKRSMLNLGSMPVTTLAVVPLDRHIENSCMQYEQRVALIFSRSGMCETLMMSFFSRAYQLTHSEEQILSLICLGQTAPEMARELRVGQATVRTHIRSICQKTHSHGIREVTKRLALLPPLMVAVMPGAFA